MSHRKMRVCWPGRFPLTLLFLGLLAILSACSRLSTPVGRAETLDITITTPDKGEAVLEGKFIKDVPAGMIIGLSGDGTEIELLVDGTSIIWDGIAWVAEMPVVPGDHIVAYGTWKSDKTFVVEKLYANILNLRGVVQGIDSEKETFIVRDIRQGDLQVGVNPDTEIWLQGGQRPGLYKDSHLFPEVGDYIEVIGRKIKDGVVAVNMVVSD
jgi:hypothetical protein